MRIAHAIAVALLVLLAAALLTACGGTSDNDTSQVAASSGSAPDPSGSSAPIHESSLVRPYRYDLEGSLPLDDLRALPVVPGTVSVHWQTFRGWYVAALDGLDLESAGTVCFSASLLNESTSRVEQATASPSQEGACDDEGAGPLVIAPATAGLRLCGGAASYLTTIPADLSGVLFLSLTAFQGDGTAIGVSSRFDVEVGQLQEIDELGLSCGPLPREHVLRPPQPSETGSIALMTPLPASEGDVDAANRAAPPAPSEVEGCVPAEIGTLQDVTQSDAGFYFVHHPRVDDPAAPTVVFLSGGTGSRGGAARSWERFFGGGGEGEKFRVVLPYSPDVPFIDEARRTFAILNEVLWCYGGDPAKVHLAGASNGGLAAFALMTERPQLFATLLGAPGTFPTPDPARVDPAVWAETLAGRAVFNGVGATDLEWKAEVIATHNALAAAGIESTYVEFVGQGHIISSEFDESVFLDFWSRP